LKSVVPLPWLAFKIIIGSICVTSPKEVEATIALKGIIAANFAKLKSHTRSLWKNIYHVELHCIVGKPTSTLTTVFFVWRRRKLSFGPAKFLRVFLTFRPWPSVRESPTAGGSPSLEAVPVACQMQCALDRGQILNHLCRWKKLEIHIIGRQQHEMGKQTLWHDHLFTFDLKL